jgi:hypothetical protein
MSMKNTLTQQLVFLKRGSLTSVDPRARLKGAFELIGACLKNQDYKLASGSRELAAAGYAVSVVLRNVLVLTKLAERRRWAEGPDLRELKAMLQLLDRGPTHEDVVAAMDFANESLPKMLEGFSRAELQEYFPESDSEEARREREYARYKCAALLPLLVEEMETIWLPLQKKCSGVVSKHGQ